MPSRSLPLSHPTSPAANNSLEIIWPQLKTLGDASVNIESRFVATVACAFPSTVARRAHITNGALEMKEAMAACPLFWHPADFTIREDGVVRLNLALARRVAQFAA